MTAIGIQQAIHPEQINIIHSSFAPSEIGQLRFSRLCSSHLSPSTDILKAARIKFSFEHHDQLGKGAYTLDGFMIDAPVYKQASKILAKAEAAGLEIPKVTLSDIQ